MNKAFNFLIIAALLLGCVSIFLIIKYVETREAKARESAPSKEWVMQSVLVAKEAITVGSAFTKFNTEVVSVPEDFVPEGVITSLSDLDGQIALHAIPVGDILMSAKCGSPKALPRASAVIPKGKRLVTIEVEEAVAAGFTIKNGDFVDLVASVTISEEMLDREEMPIGENLSVTFLQKVEVFDIIHGQSTAVTSQESSNDTPDPDAGRLAKGTTATFLVTPEQAQIILNATNIADGVYMLLRRYDDEDTFTQPTALLEKISSLIAGEGQEPTVEPVAPVEAPTAPARKIVF